jgi:hypothetical protein
MCRSNYRVLNPCQMLISPFVSYGLLRISREVIKEKEVRGAYCTTHVWGRWIRLYGSTSGKSSYIIFFITIYAMICY